LGRPWRRRRVAVALQGDRQDDSAEPMWPASKAAALGTLTDAGGTRTFGERVRPPTMAASAVPAPAAADDEPLRAGRPAGSQTHRDHHNPKVQLFSSIPIHSSPHLSSCNLALTYPIWNQRDLARGCCFC